MQTASGKVCMTEGCDGTVTGRQRYCTECTVRRKREQNARHQAVRPSRARDLPSDGPAAHDPSGPEEPGGFDPDAFPRALAALHDAVDAFLRLEHERRLLDGLVPGHVDSADPADDFARLDEVARAEEEAAFLRALPEGLRPAGKAPLPDED